MRPKLLLKNYDLKFKRSNKSKKDNKGGCCTKNPSNQTRIKCDYLII